MERIKRQAVRCAVQHRESRSHVLFAKIVRIGRWGGLLGGCEKFLKRGDRTLGRPGPKRPCLDPTLASSLDPFPSSDQRRSISNLAKAMRGHGLTARLDRSNRGPFAAPWLTLRLWHGRTRNVPRVATRRTRHTRHAKQPP